MGNQGNVSDSMYNSSLREKVRIGLSTEINKTGTEGNPRPTGVFGRTRPTRGGGNLTPPPANTRTSGRSEALNEYFLGYFDNFL